eukprot:5776318-Prymnesium_polylepis.1
MASKLPVGYTKVKYLRARSKASDSASTVADAGFQLRSSPSYIRRLAHAQESAAEAVKHGLQPSRRDGPLRSQGRPPTAREDCDWRSTALAGGAGGRRWCAAPYAASPQWHKALGGGRERRGRRGTSRVQKHAAPC